MTKLFRCWMACGICLWLGANDFAARAQTIPNSPSNLLATDVSFNRINLSWTDNSTNEDGFTIERSLDGTNFTQIAQVLPNTVTYGNLGLFPNVTYSYRIRAFNSGGTSGYSDVTSVTTTSTCPGSVIGWGDNTYGQLTPPPGLTNAMAISAGGSHSLALRLDGTVVGWGNNAQGQTNPPAGLTGVVAIAAGGSHSLALRGDGTVVGWGNNAQGQTNPPAGLTGVVAIAAGDNHSLALKADGTVVGWGANQFWGQATPPAGLTGVVAIAASGDFSLALKNDGTVIGWGFTICGQGTPPADLSGVVQIAAGGIFTLVLKSDGTIRAWGCDNSGAVDVPWWVQYSQVLAIASSGSHSLALTSWGSITYWGDIAIPPVTPNMVSPPSGATVEAITTGGSHALALVVMLNAPSGLAADPVSSNEVDLSWTNDASNPGGYQIEVDRTPDDNGYLDAWTPIAVLDGTNTTYRDNGLAENMTYWYRVVAYFPCAASPDSNLASAATPNLTQYNGWVNSASGLWQDGTNWWKGIPPDASQGSIFITNADAKTVLLDSTTVTNPSVLTVSNLTISGSASATNSLAVNLGDPNDRLHVLNGFTLSTGAALLVTNSSLAVDNLRLVATNVFDGVTTVAAGGTLAATSPTTLSCILGSANGAQGLMTINGGTAILQDLVIGSASNASGEVTLTAGSLELVNTEEAVIGSGPYSVGTLTLSGGTCEIHGPTQMGSGTYASGNLVVGQAPGANGTLWLTGGELDCTNDWTSDLVVGCRGGTGVTIVSNGVINASIVDVGPYPGVITGGGTMTILGGTVTDYGSLGLGGTMDVRGGTFLTGETIFQGGQLLVSGGEADPGTLYFESCGTPSVLLVTGGTVHAGDIHLNGGTIIVSGGTFTADSLQDTDDPCGRFIHSGGFVSINTMTLNPTNNITGDGLPNWWKQQYGLDPLSTNGVNGVNGDADGDGMSNWQEYLAGTDPTNPASAFRITSVVQTGKDLQVTWMTGIGKTNALQAANGGYATNGYADIFTVTNTVTTATNYLDVGGATNKPARYYRVRLVP